MEEPQRTRILESFQILNSQFDVSVDRGRADLQAGLPLEDLIAGGIAEFSEATPESLAAVLICRMLKEARKPVPKPRKKTAIPARRERRLPKPLAREGFPDVGGPVS